MAICLSLIRVREKVVMIVSGSLCHGLRIPRPIRRLVKSILTVTAISLTVGGDRTIQGKYE